MGCAGAGVHLHEVRGDRGHARDEESAGEHLIDVGAVLVGIDYLSIDPYETGERCPVHRRLLGAGVAVLEGADLRGTGRLEHIAALERTVAMLRELAAQKAPEAVGA